MIVYSKKIVQFLGEIKSIVKDVLSQEVGLRIRNNRFYDPAEMSSYPIDIVIYNNTRTLGYFDPNFYELGFHECLMHVHREQLKKIIKHELAHYLTFINYGTGVPPHGIEFREFCMRMGWGEEIYRATCCLEGAKEVVALEESSVFRKVRKLMALASSSNENEAEQAMIKSQQLLLEHNLEAEYLDRENEEKILLKRILKQKKKDAKMRAIGTILKTFFVSVVYTRCKEYTYVEIVGSAVNVEVAEYVAAVLQFELDKFWKQAQKQSHLKGTIAKNSFFIGLAKGYCNKVEALKRTHQSSTTRALMIIEKKLLDAQAMVYQRLTSSKSSASYCSASAALGECMGHQLNINPALKKPSTSQEALIAYSS